MPIAKKKPRVVYFPMDLMTPSQKKNYILKNSGKVKVSYMYDRLEFVKSVEEIQEMDFEKAQEYILNVMNTHGAKKLKEHWSLSPHGYYNVLLTKYNIVTGKGMKPYIDNSAKTQNNMVINTQSATINNSPQNKENDGVVLQKLIEEKVEQQIEKMFDQKMKTIVMNISEIYNGKELSEELTDIGAFFEKKENQSYKIELLVTKN